MDAEVRSLVCAALYLSISHQLEEAISGAIVRPIWQVAASEGVVIGKIQLLLAVVTLAANRGGYGDCLINEYRDH